LHPFDFSQTTPAGPKLPKPPLDLSEQVDQQGDRILINAGPSEAGWHRLETWLRCRQLYAYHHILGLRMGGREALNRGSLLHVGVAHHYARWAIMRQGWLDHDGERITDPDRFYTPGVAMQLATDQEDHADDRRVKEALLGTCQHVVQAYIEHYAPRDVFKVLAVEQQFRASVGPKQHLFTARADLVVEDTSGRVWIVDHKSSSRPKDGKTIRRYALSGQVHCLTHLGKMNWGKRFAGVQLNIIGWKNSGPPVNFGRAAPEPAPAMTGRMVQLIVDAEAEMKAWRESGRNPHEYPVAASEYVCMTPYGTCDGWDLCAWGSKVRGNP